MVVEGNKYLVGESLLGGISQVKGYMSKFSAGRWNSPLLPFSHCSSRKTLTLVLIILIWRIFYCLLVQKGSKNDSYQIITFIEERVPSIYYLANHITKTKTLNFKKFYMREKTEQKVIFSTPVDVTILSDLWVSTWV